MLRLPILVAGLCSVALAAPHGRVVRVERESDGAVAEPRLCQFQARDLSGMCLGSVKPGDVAILLSNDAVVGEVRIDEAKPTKDTCEVLQSVKVTILKGNIGSNFVGIVGRGTDPERGRVLLDTSTTPSPNGRDQVRSAIDRDGDGVADLVMTQSPCEPTGSVNARSLCFDMWASSRGRAMHQIQHVDLQACF